MKKSYKIVWQEIIEKFQLQSINLGNHGFFDFYGYYGMFFKGEYPAVSRE